jgi:hypothetical protein
MPPGVQARFQDALTGQSRPPAPAGSYARHLIVAYRPGWQSLEDLNTIAHHVADLDPTIRTFIVPTTSFSHITRREAAKRPTFVVSNGRMLAFRPMRGKVYQGWPIEKMEEVRRLAKAGVPVPRTEILTADTKLDPADWGEFVILKPTDIGTSSHGLGIQLMRTERVRYIPPQDYPNDHPGRLGPMIVQQYINTGDKVSAYRVMTYFGEPLSATYHAMRTEKVKLTASNDEIEKAPIAIQTAGTDRDRAFVSDPEIIDLARRAHDALPEIPLKGCDILRDEATGKLYVLELNAGGNTWHFSSQFFAETRRKDPEHAAQRRRQFDAIRLAARILVNRTIDEAE